MGLIKALRDAFGNRPDRALTGPESFDAEADADGDSADMLGEAPSPPQANVDGLVLGLVYEDANGHVSRRMVRVKAIGPSPDGAGYVHGYCQLREDDRTFSIDGIREVVDHRTGETYTDPEAFFLPYVEIARWRDFAEPAEDTGAMTNPTQMVLSSVRDEIKIVLYVARADGTFQIDEQDVISDFIADRAAALGPKVANEYEHERIMAWARTMNPDYASFERAVQRLAERPDVDVAEVWRTCKKLVMADRTIEPREVDAMDSLFVAIRSAGISKPLD